MSNGDAVDAAFSEVQRSGWRRNSSRRSKSPSLPCPPGLSPRRLVPGEPPFSRPRELIRAHAP